MTARTSRWFVEDVGFWLVVCPAEDWRNAIWVSPSQAALAKELAERLGLRITVDESSRKLYIAAPISPKTTSTEKLTPHFHLEEFRSGDGAPFPQDVIPRLREVAERLEKLRTRLGDRPITVTSGYRSPAWNAHVGGVPNSQHLLGRAADIVVPGVSVDEIARAGREVGFKGIGRYYRSGFVHLDIREGPGASWTD